MRAAICLRVKTDEQRGRQSIATQRGFAEGYRERNQNLVCDCWALVLGRGMLDLAQRISAGAERFVAGRCPRSAPSASQPGPDGRGGHERRQPRRAGSGHSSGTARRAVAARCR
jgi:hypothetical protein